MTVKYFDALDFDIVYNPEYHTIIEAPDAAQEDATAVENDQTQESETFDYRNSLIRYESFVQPQQGSTVAPGESVMLKARIWDDSNNSFILRSDVLSIKAFVYQKIGRTFNTVEWRKTKELDVPLTAFPTAPSEEDWLYDEAEFNFVWIVDQTEPLFEDLGDYALQLKITFTDRLPSVVTFDLT